MPEKVKTTEYELVIVSKIGAEKVGDTVKQLITNNGGEIVKLDEQGSKELAYQIKGEKLANYTFVRVNLPPAAPAAISKVLNITEDVLRYLLTKTDAKAEAWIAENKKAMEKRAAERANDAE